MSEWVTDTELTEIQRWLDDADLNNTSNRPSFASDPILSDLSVAHICLDKMLAELARLRAAYDRVCIELAEITQAYVDKTTQAYDLQQDLVRLRAANAAAEQKTERLRKALKEIKDTQGKVCPEFDICDHAACISSYTSWTIADSALLDDGEETSNG